MTEVMVAVIGSVGLILAALIPHLLKQRRDMRAVKHQVQNNHETNLRDDIDSIRDEVRAGFYMIHDRLSAVHQDIATERRERLDLAERIEKRRR